MSRGVAPDNHIIARASHDSGTKLEEYRTSSKLQVAQSPVEQWFRVASPFRNLLGFLKPPTGLSSLHSSESPRATENESLTLGVWKQDSGGELSSQAQGVVVVAFNAHVKDVPHAGILWALEHVLKRGDTLTIVSVLDSVRGPMGYRVKLRDPKWVSLNQNLLEAEAQQTMKEWKSFPELERRCAEGGVKLVVMVKAAKRSEFAVCEEAMKLGAYHVVLDSSLKKRHREFYLQNLSCNVTRMRRHGGVDVIRPTLDMAMLMGLVPQGMKSPNSFFPKPRLSYGEQIDEFEITLKPKYSSPSPKESKLRLASARDLSSSSTSSIPSLVSARSFTSSSNYDMEDDLFSIFHGSIRHNDLFSVVVPPSVGYESDDLFSIGNASSRHTLPAAPPQQLDFHHSHNLSFSNQPLLFESPDSIQDEATLKE